MKKLTYCFGKCSHLCSRLQIDSYQCSKTREKANMFLDKCLHLCSRFYSHTNWLARRLSPEAFNCPSVCLSVCGCWLDTLPRLWMLCSSCDCSNCACQVVGSQSGWIGPIWLPRKIIKNYNFWHLSGHGKTPEMAWNRARKIFLLIQTLRHFGQQGFQFCEFVCMSLGTCDTC